MLKILILSFVCVQLPSNFDVVLSPAPAGSPKYSLVELDSERAVVRNFDNVNRTLSLTDIQGLTFSANQTEENSGVGPVLRLVDDSRIHFRDYTTTGRYANVALQSGVVLQIDVRHIDWVRTRVTESSNRMDESWHEAVSESEIEGDVLVVDRKGELRSVEGVIEEVSDANVSFSIGSRSATIERGRVFGFKYYHAAGREMSGPIASVELVDGSRVYVKRFRLDDGVLKLASVSDVEFSIAIEHIAHIDFGSVRSTYLSELVPSTIDWQALFESKISALNRETHLPRAKHDYRGQPLALSFSSEHSDYLQTVNEFDRGYAMAGGSKVAFALGAQYKHLNGWAGFDPKANRSGSVELLIQADGREVFKKEMRHIDSGNAIPLNIDLTGVQRLVIRVGYLDGLSVGDVLHLCDLKVTK